MTFVSKENPDFNRLASIAGDLESEYKSASDEAWIGSPFAWIRSQASRRRGKIGEEMIEQWCAGAGLRVDPSPDSDCDLVIEEHRAEVKFSTRWENNLYVFQQLRDQDYEFVVCLGISPFEARLWAIPKDILRAQPEGVSPQHGGASGTDTLWMRVDADTPPSWLDEWGGSLEAGTAALRRLLS